MASPAPPASIAPVPVQNAPVPAVVVADDVAAAVAEPEAEPVAEPVAVDAVVPAEHAGDANIAEGDGRTEEQGDESVCVICHDTIDKTDQANTHFHWCGHVFHRFCMMDWKQVSPETLCWLPQPLSNPPSEWSTEWSFDAWSN